MMEEVTLYIVPIGKWDTDVAGILVTPEGEALYTHVSSSMAWLEADLTRNFGREDELKALYPQGYKIVKVESTDALPQEVQDKAKARSKEETNEPEET